MTAQEEFCTLLGEIIESLFKKRFSEVFSDNLHVWVDWERKLAIAKILCTLNNDRGAILLDTKVVFNSQNNRVLRLKFDIGNDDILSDEMKCMVREIADDLKRFFGIMGYAVPIS